MGCWPGRRPPWAWAWGALEAWRAASLLGKKLVSQAKKRKRFLFSPWPALRRTTETAGSVQAHWGCLPAPPRPASLGPAGDWEEGAQLSGPWAPWDVATGVLSPAPAPLAFLSSSTPRKGLGTLLLGCSGPKCQAGGRVGWSPCSGVSACQSSEGSLCLTQKRVCNSDGPARLNVHQGAPESPPGRADM